MAGNIKGITIQFRGETKEFDEALRKINSEIKSTDSELKKVNNALKFNPSSVELWRQKQDLLKQKISETKEKLDTLKDTQKKVDGGEIEMTAAEYRNLQREIVESESKLKTFNGQLRQIGNANLKALSAQLKDIGDKVTNAGQAMTTKVTAPIVAGYTAAAKYASDYEENLNKLDVAFGSNSQAVKDWANNAREAYGLSKVQATDAASAFGALGKGIGLSDAEAASMSTTLAGLSADLGSYFNVGVSESAKALEGIFTGESEALKKFGVVMTDTNLQQFAADQGLVWSAMSQSEKTALRYQFVLEKTKDAQGDFSRTSDGTANSTKIFQASIQDLATSIGTNLLPIITPVIQKITEWVNKFNELSPSTQKVITIIGLIVAAIGPVLVIIGTLASSIGSIVGLVGMVGPVIAGLAGPIAIAIGVISVLIAVGVALYKNWDSIKAKALEIKASIVQAWNNITMGITNTINMLKASLSMAWESIKATAQAAWNAVKTAITTPIQTAWTTVKGWIDRLKNLFPLRVGKIFSDLKVPHINVSGGKAPFGIGGKGSAPHISVDWYKRAMDNPYMFSSPTFFGAGEAGDEMLYGRAALMRDIADAVANGGGAGNAPGVVVNVYGSDNMSVSQLADEVERRLIEAQKRRRLVWQ